MHSSGPDERRRVVIVDGWLPFIAKADICRSALTDVISAGRLRTDPASSVSEAGAAVRGVR
jgi:hypothetical protein